MTIVPRPRAENIMDFNSAANDLRRQQAAEYKKQRQIAEEKEQARKTALQTARTANEAKAKLIHKLHTWLIKARIPTDWNEYFRSGWKIGTFTVECNGSYESTYSVTIQLIMLKNGSLRTKHYGQSSRPAKIQNIRLKVIENSIIALVASNRVPWPEQ